MISKRSRLGLLFSGILLLGILGILAASHLFPAPSFAACGCPSGQGRSCGNCYYCARTKCPCGSCPDACDWKCAKWKYCKGGTRSGCDCICGGHGPGACCYSWWISCEEGCNGDDGCFLEGTEVETKSQSDKETKEIQELEPGDIVSSFDPETGEVSESQVAEVHQLTREGYYELETESGKKVKVTGEHPFLTVKSEENLISKLKNALSNTLIFRLITSLRAKLIEVLD